MRVCKYTPPVVGLDMSLTGTAAVAFPAGWDRATKDVRSMTVGTPLVKATGAQKIERIFNIVTAVVDFVRESGRPCKVSGGVSAMPAVFIEGYAYSARSASVTQLAELGGAVRYALLRDLGIIAREVPASSARLYLLGKLPRGKGTQKPAAVAGVRACGFEFGTVDEFDAWVITNFGLAEVGGVGFSLAAMGDRSPATPVT